MEEINLAELFKFFISKIKFIAIATVACLVLGLVYVGFIITPMYHSSTTLILVGGNDNQNSTTTQNDINLNKNLVSTYSEIVKSRTVLQQVIDKLKLDKSITDLSKNITVSSVENTEIIRTDGNEFLIYLVGYSEKQVATYALKLENEMK